MRFRVAIVDANIPVREGLSAALATVPRLELVGAVRDIYEFLDLSRRAEPDAVILSTSARGLGILGSIRLLRTLFPPVRIAVLGATNDPVASSRCADAGADAYLDGRSPTETVVSEIVALTRDSSPDRRGPSERDAARVLDPLRTLTRREGQILGCIVRGSSVPEIAREFDLSQKTVREHWARIRGKLGFSSQADAIAYWAGLHRSDAVPDGDGDSAPGSGDPLQITTPRSR